VYLAKGIRAVGVPKKKGRRRKKDWTSSEKRLSSGQVGSAKVLPVLSEKRFERKVWTTKTSVSRSLERSVRKAGPR
jgi:hypothetical protein